MPFLYQPHTPHQCKLPWRSLSLGFPPGVPGARWQCDECGKKWIYLTYSGVRGWKPLRWWHQWTRPMRSSGGKSGRG